jgi:phosphate transport system substrate-binding protein
MPNLSTLKTRRAVAVVTATAVAAVAVPATASAIPVISMSGSTSVAPLASLLAKEYLKTKKLKGKLRFKLAQGGSDVGVNDVAQEKVSIGNSSRDPKSSDSGVVFNKIAKDAICIVTNPANTVPNLTQSQIQGIFSGKIRNWEDVPGATASGTINLNVRTPASGTQDAFQKIFMGTSTVSSTAAAKASNGLIQTAVKNDKNAVGYVSADFTPGTHATPYAGVPCSLANAKSGQYGGVRSFYMVTKGAARGAVKKFITWVQTAAAAQKVIGRHWVPLK